MLIAAPLSNVPLMLYNLEILYEISNYFMIFILILHQNTRLLCVSLFFPNKFAIAFLPEMYLKVMQKKNTTQIQKQNHKVKTKRVCSY